MSLFSKIYGTIAPFFQLGGPSGSGINNNVGALEIKNSTNSAFAILRASDPVNANDLVTKQYLDGYAFPAGKAIQIEVDFGTIPTRSKTFTIIDSNISTLTNLVVTQSGAAATGRSSDENEMDPIMFSGTPSFGQFTLIASALNGPVVGKFKVNYIVG